MIDLGDRGLLLFDGDCGVCSKLAEWAAERDGGRYFRVEPYFEFSEEQLAPYGLNWADCTRAVQLTRNRHRISAALGMNECKIRTAEDVGARPAVDDH